MNDETKRLLELAAKAYFGEHYKGEVRWVAMAHGGFWEALTEGQSHDDALGFQRFDPENYSDDAFSVAVKLGIGIRSNGPDHWQDPSTSVALYDIGESGGGRILVRHGDDPVHSSRRAVLRAAAAIGEAMP